MKEIAAIHYRVERIESDQVSTYRRIAWQVASPFVGAPLVRPSVPDPNRPLVLPEAEADDIRRGSQADVVRILDREGNVVWWRDFRFREAGVRREVEITDDLMKLDPAAFRRKYAIIPERPLAAEPPRGGEADPWGPWGERVRRSEGGSEWVPPKTDNDAGWGDWGKR